MDIFPLVSGTEGIKVNYFINQDHQWDKSLLSQFIQWAISKVVANLFIPSNHILYKMFWALSPDGNYSVELCVELLQGRNWNSTETLVCHWTWKLKVPPKV